MHTQTFKVGNIETTVEFNPDFSGMAVISWGTSLTGYTTIEVPAIVLTVGIADLADELFLISEKANNLKDQITPGESPI